MKSNFRATLEVVAEPRLGDEIGRDGFLRAGDCKKVFMGDFDRGGSRTLARLRSERTAVGSGIEPESSVSAQV